MYQNWCELVELGGSLVEPGWVLAPIRFAKRMGNVSKLVWAGWTRWIFGWTGLSLGLNWVFFLIETFTIIFCKLNDYFQDIERLFVFRTYLWTSINMNIGCYLGYLSIL